MKKERDFGIASGKKTIGLSWRGSGASKGGAPCSRALAVSYTHLVHTAAHGLEIGEHTAQPSGVDIEHAAALSLFPDRVLGPVSYTHLDVYKRQGEERIPTGRKKVGAMLGDYVEVGCNSVLNPCNTILF